MIRERQMIEDISKIKSNVKTSEDAHRQSRRLRHKIVIKKDKGDKDKDLHRV